MKIFFMSPNDGVEVKVESFACFQPNENLESSPVVSPSLLQWAEYLLTPAMETNKQKLERLHKLGEKPMKQYNMTHTMMKSCPMQEYTANVVTTSSEQLADVDITTKAWMLDVVNKTFLETLVDTSAEEVPTTKNTPSVMLLYRIGEALQAAKKTHDHLIKLRKPPGFVYNDSKIKGGIASLVQFVQSINKEEKQLDFVAAMDWLERESKMGNSLVINLTRLGDNDSSSDNGSAISEHDSEDSHYKEGGGDSTP